MLCAIPVMISGYFTSSRHRWVAVPLVVMIAGQVIGGQAVVVAVRTYKALGWTKLLEKVIEILRKVEKVTSYALGKDVAALVMRDNQEETRLTMDFIFLLAVAVMAALSKERMHEPTKRDPRKYSMANMSRQSLVPKDEELLTITETDNASEAAGIHLASRSKLANRLNNTTH
jgi:hypothetical protein